MSSEKTSETGVHLKAFLKICVFLLGVVYWKDFHFLWLAHLCDLSTSFVLSSPITEHCHFLAFLYYSVLVTPNEFMDWQRYLYHKKRLFVVISTLLLAAKRGMRREEYSPLLSSCRLPLLIYVSRLLLPSSARIQPTPSAHARGAAKRSSTWEDLCFCCLLLPFEQEERHPRHRQRDHHSHRERHLRSAPGSDCRLRKRPEHDRERDG